MKTLIKKYRPYIILFYLLTAVGLIAATFLDLKIDIALNDPNDIFAIWLRNTGEIPGRMICPLAGAVLFYTCGKTYEKIISALISLGGSAYLGYYIGDYFFVENQLMFGIVFGLGIGCIILITGKYIHIPNAHKEILKKLAILGIVVMAIQLSLVEIIKILWGRVRFRDLVAAGSYDAFTPWYHINGTNGNKSFPSGHTAGAGMSYLLMTLGYLSKRSEKRAGIYFFISLIYTSAVAYSRLVLGAHYLSDVAAGGMISFTLVLIAMAVYEKINKKHTLHVKRN